MLRFKKFTHLLFSAAIFCIGWAAGIGVAQAQNEVGIAAIVNEDIITQFDVIARMRLAMISGHLADSEEARRRLMPQILRSLIDDRLKVQEAGKQDIKVEQADIDQRLERIAQRNNMSRAQFEDSLKQNGILLDTVTRQIDADLKWSRIIQRKLRPRILVTNDDIQEELTRMKSSVAENEYRLFQIFLAVDSPNEEQPVRESAMRLLDQLQSGADFSELAAQFSQDESAARGGDWGWARLGQMDPEVAKGIQAIPVGQIVGPVRGTGGYYLAVARETRLAGMGTGTSGVVNLRQILWPLEANATDGAAERARAEAKKLAPDIQGCETLPDVVRKAGTGLYRDLGSILVEDLPADIESAALNLPIGVPSEPIRSERGIGLYVICERTQGSEAAMSKVAIAERLGNQRLETLARGYLSDLRRSAVIDVRMGQ